MTKYTTISVYEADLDRLDIISSVSGKDKAEIMHTLLTELEGALKDAVQHHAKNGNMCFSWQLMTKRVGLNLQLTFVPKAKVETKECAPCVATYNRKGKLVKVTE